MSPVSPGSPVSPASPVGSARPASGDFDFTGKVAVVTGGASGIGYAIAHALRAEGVAVVIADVERSSLERAAAELGATGVVTDVTSRADIEALAAEVIRQHGRIDILVNNAGVAKVVPFDELSLDDFAWIIGVNLWGVINGTKIFLPLMEETSEDGYILNTASIAGLVAGPGLAAYATSKYGVVAFTEAVSQELAQRGARVSVGVLMPAMVRTRIASSARNRPGVDPASVPEHDIPAGVHVLEAEDVAAIAVEAIGRRDLYVLTHPETREGVRRRHARIDAAFDAIVGSAPAE